MEAERVDAESEGLADVSNVPAGTPTSAVCQIAGVGAIEAATAQKLACDNPLLGAVIDKHGYVLAMGRTRRLVTKAQRRALMIRDGMCRYPGCHQTRHLKAHHRVPWIAGGRTDLDNLILLRLSHESRACPVSRRFRGRIGRGRECALERSGSVVLDAAVGEGLVA
jgi:hypothetical protein